MQPLRPILSRQRAADGAFLSGTASPRQRQRWRRPDAPAALHCLAARCVSTARARRKVLQLKQDVPLFEIPTTVLDLDAEDNPNVRLYDEETEADETARWRDAHASIDALSERLKGFALDADRAEARMTAVAAAPTPWRVSDRDIWSVALLGSNETSVSKVLLPGVQKEVSVIGALLHQNGISPRAASEPSKTIEFLLHRQHIVEKAGIDSVEELEQALSSCRSLTQVRRLLTLAARTTTGCNVVAQYGSALAERLSLFLSGSSNVPDEAAVDATAAEAVSTLLLNLSYSFASKGVDLGRQLCALGLRAAAATGEPPTLQRFLHVGLCAGYFQEESETSILSALSSIHTLLQEGGPAEFKGSHAALFTLLTGKSRLLHREPTVQDVSFRAAITAGQKDGLGSVVPQVRRVYLAILAELGAVRTLWEEKHKPEGTTIDIENDVLVSGVLRYATCTAAAKSAIVEGPAAAIGKQKLAGDVKDEVDSCLLDFDTIYAYDAAAATPRQPMSLLPTLRAETTVRVSATTVAIDDHFRGQIDEAFNKESLEETMSAIEAILPQ